MDSTVEFFLLLILMRAASFLYDRNTGEFIDIWNNSKPVEDILPLSIWWLDKKHIENGMLQKKNVE